MHIIKTHSIPTDQPDTFLVYWTNSLPHPRGVLKVRILPKIEDRRVAAELSAIQYLLEDKCVAGRHVIGNNNTQLTCSMGAIRKLQRKGSDKAHLAPYANFLTTRFAGCPVNVENDGRWIEGFTDEPEELLIAAPRRESIRLAGLGEVSITQHVLERFSDRILAQTGQTHDAQVAWKKLREAVSDPSVREIAIQKPWGAMKHASNGKQVGRYFLNARHNLVLVVTDNPGEGKRLVTTYQAPRKFQTMAHAA